MKNLTEKILQRFAETEAKYELIKLPEGIGSAVEEHMQFHGGDLSQANVNLVYKTNQGFVVVQKRGDTKIDNKQLRKALESSEVRFASREEMTKLGLEPGLVPTTGHDLPIFTDRKLLQSAVLFSTASDNIHALKFFSQDLMKLNPNMRVVDVTTSEENKVIHSVVSGITPSGSELHIGNYFGAVKPHIELQSQLEQSFYFIADLHALTTVQDHEMLEKNILNVVLDYLALGLDPKKCVFFRQSDVPEHAQLAVILGNYVSYGQMQRMHAFKDKLGKGMDVGAINMGLFNYPILMAADILLYKPDGVPVGEDQRQHVELTRDIAEHFNRTYGQNVFPLPDPVISEATGRIVGTDGERKMGKSLNNYISIFEKPEIIKKQIMGSYTDPNRIKASDPGKVEGNPIFVYHDLINENVEEVSELKERYSQGKVGDVEVKEKLIAAHERRFALARSRRELLSQKPEQLKDILREGARKARLVAKQTLEEVEQVIGIKFRS